MAVSSHTIKLAALAATIAAFQTVAADYYVTYGPQTPPGGIYRLANDGSVESFTLSLVQPLGLAFLDNDIIVACDLGDQKLRLIHADGTDLGVFADMVDANAVIVDSFGNVLVNEYFTGLIRRFAPNGTDLGVFASTGLSRQGQLAMDTSGNIYTSSFFPGEQVIYKYDPLGNFLGVFSSFASSGIHSPTGMAFQSDGSMIVSNTYVDTMDRLDASGNFLNQFASTGMREPVWVTVEPDDSVLLPSWTGGWIQRYDAAGNDLGVFASISNCYQIVRGPDVFTPNAVQVFRGRIDAGSVASLAETDGDELRVCRFIVLNSAEPPVQMEFTGTTTETSPSGLSVAVTSKMASSGAFSQELVMVDKNGAQSATERRTDGLGAPLKQVRLTVAGDPTNFVRPDGTVKLRLNVRPAGPTSVLIWCHETDRVAWTVRP